MIRAEPRQLKALAHVADHQPDVMSFLESVLQKELGSLPYAVERPALFMGRCQMITEICKYFREAPSLAARL